MVFWRQNFLGTYHKKMLRGIGKQRVVHENYNPMHSIIFLVLFVIFVVYFFVPMRYLLQVFAY